MQRAPVIRLRRWTRAWRALTCTKFSSCGMAAASASVYELPLRSRRPAKNCCCSAPDASTRSRHRRAVLESSPSKHTVAGSQNVLWTQGRAGRPCALRWLAPWRGPARPRQAAAATPTRHAIDALTGSCACRPHLATDPKLSGVQAGLAPLRSLTYFGAPVRQTVDKTIFQVEAAESDHPAPSKRMSGSLLVRSSFNAAGACSANKAQELCDSVGHCADALWQAPRVLLKRPGFGLIFLKPGLVTKPLVDQSLLPILDSSFSIG